jgi:Tfp pilus assembly protein PilO
MGKFDLANIPKEILQIVFLGLLLFGGGGWAYVTYLWNPTADKIAALGARVEANRKVIDAARGQEAELKGTLLKLRGVQKEAASAGADFPVVSMRENFNAIVTMEVLMGRFGVSVVSMSVAAPKKTESYIELPVLLNVRGPFQGIANSIAALALQPRIYNFQDVTFTGPETETGIPAKMTMLLYERAL